MLKKQFFFFLTLLISISTLAITKLEISKEAQVTTSKTLEVFSDNTLEKRQSDMLLAYPAMPPTGPEVRVGTITAGAGQVLVSLEMLNFTANVNSFTFKIIANNSVLQFVELVNKAGFTGPNYQTYQNGNLLSIVYYDLGSGYMPNGKIFDMKFNFSGTEVGTLTFQATGNEVTAGIYPINNITYTSGQVNPIQVNSYIITATAGSNGIINPAGNVSVPEFGSKTFAITANSGYQVADVLVDGISVGAVTSYTFNNVTANHTIAAGFSISNPVISASAGMGGIISPSGNVTVIYGANQSFNITPNSGFNIADVLVDGVSVGAVSSYVFSNVTTNHTITASFTDGNHTINASAGVGGNISPSGNVAVINGANQTFVITPNVGYSIANVIVDGVSIGAVSNYTFNNVTANHTIAATFAINTYTIAASAGTGGSISPSGNVGVSYGANQAFIIAPLAGYLVSDVLVDGVSVGTPTTYTFSNVTANHVIAVSFTLSTQIREVKIGTVSASAGQVLVPLEMLNFVENVNSFTFKILVDDSELQFVEVTNQIGFTGPNYQAYQNGNLLSIVYYDPGAGYMPNSKIFDMKFNYTGTNIGALVFQTFGNEVTAGVNFIDNITFTGGQVNPILNNNFTITATTGENGSINPLGIITVPEFGDQSFTITPDAGYHVADVLVDGVSVGAVATYTFSNVTANHTIAASFAIDKFTITATAGANGNITPSGTISVNYGASQAFAITPAVGYHITDVLVDGVSVGAVTTYTFSNVTANHTIAPSFAIDTFIIIASAGENGSINPSGNVIINYGASQTFLITPNTSYNIANVLVDGVSVGPVSSYTFSNVTANHTIAASFAIKTFTIAATAGANGSITPSGSISVDYGASQAFAITPAVGYHVANVLVDGISVGSVATYTFSDVTANHTISASFAIDTFTIAATAGTNGSITPSGTISINYGASQAFAITPAVGYHVADVLVDGVSVGAVATYIFSNVTANHTIAASFAIDTFTITATAGTNGSITPSGSVSVNYGASQAFAITPAVGYHLADVLVDGVSVGAVATYTFSNVTANHTIAASFAIDTFITIATAGENGSINPSGNVIINYGASQTFLITPNTSYIIANVLVDGVSVGPVSSYTFSNVTANHTIAASFAINTFTIAATAGANGSITPSGSISVNYGASQAFTITPTVGYHIADVLVDGISVGAVATYTFSNVTANHTIAASFAINTFTIAATAGANGSITPSGNVTVNYGASQTFLITPNTSYVIANVLVDGVSVGPVTSYTFSNVTASHTISVTFALNFYVINATAGQNGGISPSGNVTVNQGTNQTFTITPNNGYHIADVLVDGVSVGAVSTYTFFNVTANHTIAVSFAINTYVINATASLNGTITPSGNVTVNFGANQTFTITPNIGYSVSDVLVDGVSVGAVTTYTFVNVMANHTITVSFVLNTYTINATAALNGTINPPGDVTVNHGASQTFTITPNIGYSVSDVLVDGVSVGAVTTYTFFNVTANHTITVSFAINTFIISATSNEHGSVNPSGDVSVGYGESKTFEFIPAEGYKVYAFWVDGDSIGTDLSYTFNNVTANHSLYVEFTLIIGVEELPGADKLVQCWPSPATSHLFIQSYFNVLDQNKMQYLITDLKGQKLGNGKLEKTIERIELNNMTSGLLLLHVYEGTVRIRTIKVIKM